MHHSWNRTLPFAPSDPDDAAALAHAAAYLTRAGTEAATWLLSAHADAVLLIAVRDELLAGAALCDGLLDLVTDVEYVKRQGPLCS